VKSRTITIALIAAALVHLVGCGEGATVPRDDASAAAAAGAWFTDTTARSGLDFRHESGASGRLYLPEIMGGGVALFDADGDGDLDVYLVNQNRVLPETRRDDDTSNRLYLQQPDGTFVDATDLSGLGDGGFGMGVAIGDIDNDGDPDVYVTNYGPDALYRNHGDGTFEDVTRTAGIRVEGWSTSATFFDYDVDGFLDIYVAVYLDWDASKVCTSTSGRESYCGPKAFPAARDVLLHNNGDGTFADVSATAGIRTVTAAGLGVVSDDFNDDGRPDLYVTNDGHANNLWLNQRDGTFRDDALVLGAAYNLRGIPEAGMGVVAADFDGDGWPDLFMTHLGLETNTLYRNLGQGRGFSDMTDVVGLGLDSWHLTGFGTAALDVELDGDLDLFVANGRVKAAEPHANARVPAPWDELAEPNLFYLNDGSGRFANASAETGELCARVEVTRGVAAGDVDDDGDVDLLVGNIHGPARFYTNQTDRAGTALRIRARDPQLGRDAIGARIRVISGDSVQARTITRGFSYLSSSPPIAFVGIPEGHDVDRIEVSWPGGSDEVFPGGLEPASRVLVRGQGEAR